MKEVCSKNSLEMSVNFVKDTTAVVINRVIVLAHNSDFKYDENKFLCAFFWGIQVAK